MIRAHFGLDRHPFALDAIALLLHQAEVLETLRFRCQHGGLCVVVGEPGTGKSVVKHNLILVAQPVLLTKLALTPNEDLHSRVTYSVLLQRLAPDDVAAFIRAELDRAGLVHREIPDATATLQRTPGKGTS